MPDRQKESALLPLSVGILEICQNEGFEFQLKQTLTAVTARCTFPNKEIKYLVFEDHRKNSHTGKPHICSHWSKTLGDPISFTMGTDVTESTHLVRILSACAVMCITQTSAYKEMKEAIFA